MAITPTHATITNTTAGTRTRLTSTTTILPTTVYIEAAGANTGYIYVGLVTVTSTVYMARLAAGQSFTLNSDGIGGRGRNGSIGIQLSDLYIDSSVSGEKAQLTYMFPTGV